MEIDVIAVGQLQCNCYILSKNNEVLIIDPGAESNKIINMIGDKKVIGVLITHYHFDHIGALEEIKNKYNVNVYDYSNLKEDNDIGSFNFKMIETKGHTDDSVTYYFYQDNIMFTGDFLFKETIGRTDLETGNMNKMIESLNKIKNYPDDTLIYPGHGDMTNLGYEKQNNIWLNR